MQYYTSFIERSNEAFAFTLCSLIKMTNVGGRDGATPARIAEEILTTLVKEVGGAVVQAGLEKTSRTRLGVQSNDS